MPIFECRALEKRYGAAMALDHIDLALEPGRIVGLLGPNGSGKSTLIKLAMGLLQPTSGEVLIGGQAPSPQTNAVVSYLPDRITLSPWMKTRQLLDFYGDFFADFDRAAAERMLSQLGLDLNQSVRQIKQLLHRVTNHKIQLRCQFQGTAFQLLDVLRHMHPMLRTSVWLVTHDGREKMIWLTMRRM